MRLYSSRSVPADSKPRSPAPGHHAALTGAGRGYEVVGRAGGETDSASYKVRRIRRNPAVRIAPCTASGRLRRQPIPAHAEVLTAADLPLVVRLMQRKYRLDRVLVLPVYRAVQAVRRRPRPRGTPVALAITPDLSPVVAA